jgi:hypothetical protein
MDTAERFLFIVSGATVVGSLVILGWSLAI